MDMGMLWRLQPPPAPESLSLRRLRFLGAALCGVCALLIALAGPLASIDQRLVLGIVPVVAVTVVTNIIFWRRRRASNRAYWTDERRALFMMQAAERERAGPGPAGKGASR